MNFTSESAVESAIKCVLTGQSCSEVALAARRMASDILDADEIWTHLYLTNGPRLIQTLLDMLQQETVLQYLDDYTFLLTGLRQKLETFGEHRKRVANLLILEQTHGLLDVFRRGYEEDPEGYTAPELVSMWSSILNQEGVTLCAPYMLGMEETLMDCMRSRTVGSIVAILLISNLNGDQSGSIDAVVPLFSQVECAFNAAFTGEDFAERKWGPGPVTKCLSKLCGDTKISDRVANVERNNLLEKVVKVITFKKRDWPVPGFDDSYYMDAKGSACIVLGKIAQRHDVTRLCPTVQPAIESLLSDPRLSPHVRKAANTALLQLERCRQTTGSMGSERSLEDILSIDHKNSGKIAVAAAEQAQPLAAAVSATLQDAGYTVHRVGPLDTADVVEIESSDAILFCTTTTSRIEAPLGMLVRYMLSLRRPCVHVTEASHGLQDWFRGIVDRKPRLPEHGIAECIWNSEKGPERTLAYLKSRDICPILAKQPTQESDSYMLS